MTNLELIMENICEVKVAQFPIAETVESEMVTPKELIKISEEQNSILSKAMDKMDEYRENREPVKTFGELQNLELKNYTFKFADGGKYIHIVDKYTNYQYACISLGNKKLEQHNKICTFIIWNLLQVCTCPNATEGCLKFCYADKSNNGTKCKDSNSVVSRMQNTVFSMVKNFSQIMLEAIKFAKRNLGSEKGFVLRWHESGDVYDSIYREKVITVMRKSNIENLMYTKTIAMLHEINELNKSEKITVRYSLDNTTKPKVVAKVIDLNCLTTTVADKNQNYIVADRYDKRFVCNLANTQNIDKIVEEIKGLLVELELETRKTYKRKIQIKINKLSELLVNKNAKCAKCGLKCLSKKIQNIVFMCH